MVTDEHATSIARICFFAGMLCGLVLGASLMAIFVVARKAM